MESGHVLIGRRGEVLSTDRGFGRIIQTEPASIVGRRVLDITAPADRAECGAAIARLRATRQPFEIAKRMVRENGTLVWVSNTVSMVGTGEDDDLMVATVTALADPTDDRAPARLLDCARMLIEMRWDRAGVLDPTLMLETAWDAILAAYVAEAEGRAIDVPTLARRLAITEARATRWIGVLVAEGAVEIETRIIDPYAPKAFRLTAATHARLEEFLRGVGEKNASLRAARHRLPI